MGFRRAAATASIVAFACSMDTAPGTAAACAVMKVCSSSADAVGRRS